MMSAFGQRATGLWIFAPAKKIWGQPSADPQNSSNHADT